MPQEKSIEELNLDVARSINELATEDPGSPYAGKFVGIADGKVIVVAEDMDAAVAQMQLAGSDPQKSLIFEAGIDYDTPIAIWSAE